jgi:hypothetical protein
MKVALRLGARPALRYLAQTARSEVAMSDLPDIPSPCIGVCRLDPETRQCAGCLRTSREIAAWPALSNTDRLAVVQDLRRRRRALGITSPADSRPRRRASTLSG